MPRTVGEFEGEEVVASVGRFGPYLRFKGKFVSIKKDDGDDPLTIEIDRAKELILAHRKAEAEKTINRFEGEPLVQVLNGRYGPLIQALAQFLTMRMITSPVSWGIKLWHILKVISLTFLKPI